MSIQARRRIQVASFSVADMSRQHTLSVGIGIAMIAAAAVLAIASHFNARAAADCVGSARLLGATAQATLQGTQAFYAGGSAQLGSAARSAQATAAAFDNVRLRADSSLVAPGLKSQAAGAYGSWMALQAALGRLEPAASLSAAASETVGVAAPNLASLAKKLEGSRFGRAHESAVRLYSYAEGGFGIASVPRLEYDLQVLQADLAGGEMRQDVAFIEPLLAAARAAVAKKVATDDVRNAYEAAKAAKQSGAALEVAGRTMQAPLYLGGAAVLLALLGVASVLIGVRGVAREFSTRYARSMQQFRGGEQALSEVAAGLRAAGQGDLSDIAIPPNAGDMADIVVLVNDLLARVRGAIQQAQSAIGAGVRVGEGVLQAAGQAREAGEDVRRQLQAAGANLQACVGASRALALDSATLLNAADETAARSAEATRVAQDAGARLESMREGLQDTVKRIKRLGERSQEINGVVDGMELLSEQIGVLALNASLEAERAGDAGAGFRLVAREVQALARRSEEALQKMGELVQGVQADARAAAESAERSTSQVVSGANVGTVSQALLGVLTPLAESICGMAREITGGAKAAADAASSTVAATHRIESSLRDMVSQVDAIRGPVAEGGARLNSGLSAVSQLTV